MGGITDYPLLILLLVLDDDRRGSDRPILAEPLLELAALIEPSADELLALAHRGVVRDPC